MAKRLMYVEGMDGQIELLGDRVVIHRKGWFNMLFYGFNAKREIPLGAISEVAFKDAAMFQNGRIEFVRSGRSSDDRRKNNPNAVKFHKSKQEQFAALKEKIFELVDQYAKQRQQ